MDPPTTKNTLLLEAYITNQNSIGWGHFIRGLLESSFHPALNQYYRTNKLGRRFHSSVWYRTIIRLLWKIHHKAWLEYCDSGHIPQKFNTLSSPAKTTLLTLVAKYKTETDILPTHKNIFFLKELQRWLSTARKIIQRYKLDQKEQVHSKVTSNYSTILDTDINLPFQSTTPHHTIIKAKKPNHLKASHITKYYQSSVPKLHHDKQIPPIPTEPTTKIATGTSHENVVTDNNITITPVVVLEYHKQKFRHELIKTSFYNNKCTQVTSKNKMTKQTSNTPRSQSTTFQTSEKTHSIYEKNDNNNLKQVGKPKHKFSPTLPSTSNSLDTSIIPHEPFKKIIYEKRDSQNNQYTTLNPY